jgi:hypothetical protein
MAWRKSSCKQEALSLGVKKGGGGVEVVVWNEEEKRDAMASYR